MTGSPTAPRSRPRWRRVVRRFVATVLALVAVLTAASLAYNAATTPPRTVAAPGGHDVQVHGARVHYEQWGARGSPVVLVHGFVESTTAWSAMAPLLARDHTVYAVDLAGYGYSEYTGHYTLRDEAELVDGFVRILQLRRPVLVGHSLGAAVVGAVALRYPTDIGGVVFADGDALPFRKGGRPGWASLILRTPYLTTAYRVVTRSPSLARRGIRAQCGSPCPAATPRLAEAWMRPLRQGAAEEALRAVAAQPILALEERQVRAITVPRAIIWGAEDRSTGGSLAATRRNLHDPPTVVLPRAGHLSMLADPVGFAAALDRFAAAWQRGSRRSAD